MTSTAVTMAELAARLRAGVAAELDAAVALRRELHAGAEPSGEEFRTAARVAAALGAPDAPAVAGTGRLVRIGDQDGPCIALRAELDALPITEQTGVPWASQTGAMHACGHDVHLAALTAVCRAAEAARAELPVPVLAVLQPREEAIPSGARDLVASGVLAGQHPSAIVAVHLQHQLPLGTVAAAAGTVNAATDDIEITVEGDRRARGLPAADRGSGGSAVPERGRAADRCQPSIRPDARGRGIDRHAPGRTGGERHPAGAAVAKGTLRVLDEADRPGLHQTVTRDRRAHLPGLRLPRLGHHRRGRARPGQRRGADHGDLALAA